MKMQKLKFQKSHKDCNGKTKKKTIDENNKIIRGTIKAVQYPAKANSLWSLRKIERGVARKCSKTEEN